MDNEPNYLRTYEPFKFMGRFFFVPLTVAPKTSPVSYAPTWEDSGEHWGPTVVVRIPFTRRALGVGVWLDAPQDIPQIRAEDAAFDAYVAVNGNVDRDAWEEARAYIASQGLNPDDEMEMMQAYGVFE